jgi:glycine/D-amino acid oxidase-like deaminating enzyme
VTEPFDAVVVGGGFYGAVIARHLSVNRGLRRVLLVEREAALMRRASYTNQARVHNGYHYPRSFTTAYRSRINLPRFVTDWPGAIVRDFTALYAVARRNSKVNARQFERFAAEIGAPFQTARKELQALFSPDLVEAVYEVAEYAFDTRQLAIWAENALRLAGVEVALATEATSIDKGDGVALRLALSGPDGARSVAGARYVFNCTYAGLNRLFGQAGGTQARLKHELTEMALVEPDSRLKGLGITLMDGPFFSLMPFPARQLHTLSHVRYTPHRALADDPSVDLRALLQSPGPATRVDRMLRDAARYVPALASARADSSLFEIKTVLEKNEGDDGRPILFEKLDRLPGAYAVLGGKIDNVYDILERLDAEAIH